MSILTAAEKAAKAARSAEMAARAQGLARAAELRVISSLSTRARVKGLAEAAEADMKAKVAMANSGRAAHAGLSNTAKGARGKAFYARQKLAKAKAAPRGSSAVGYRSEPLPGSAAAIPRGKDVPTVGPIGKQTATRSSFYKRRK
tara:strand:+ start:549 stop:983 length:435 start_codon:yes stop_codon:yes gene_type:complete